MREYADRISAEVQIGDELKEDSLEGKLDAIAAETTNYRARARLEALKAKRAAEKGESNAEGDTEAAAPEKAF